MGTWQMTRGTSGASVANVWTGDDMPDWAELPPGKKVDTYVRPAAAGSDTATRRVAWQIQLMGEPPFRGLLGAEFVPAPTHSTLRISAWASDEEALERTFDGPYSRDLHRGLWTEMVGAVLAGASLEAAALGPGELTFGWAAMQPSETPWLIVRFLALGVVRLLAQPEVDEQIATDVFHRVFDAPPLDR